MSFPMINSKTNNIKSQYYDIHSIITKIKFRNIQILNIMMYVSIIILRINPIYLVILF